jgi:hypothetical protein
MGRSPFSQRLIRGHRHAICVLGGLNWALLDQTMDALYTSADDLRPIVTAVEPQLENARALTTDRSGESQEIPETPAAALENVRHEGTVPWDGGEAALHLCQYRSTETDRAESYSTSTIAGDGYLEVGDSEASIHNGL